MRRAAGLRQSVLRSAFLGALVPQEEADEPASVLLARIAVERAAAASEMFAAKEGKGKRRFPSGMTKEKKTTREAASRKGKAKA
jgi:type I restriction enzyme S subunit